MAAQTTTPIRTETNGPLVTGISVGFVSVSVLFLIGRFYTRGVILRSIGKDDWAMLVATVSGLFMLLPPCDGLLSNR